MWDFQLQIKNQKMFFSQLVGAFRTFLVLIGFCLLTNSVARAEESTQGMTSQIIDIITQSYLKEEVDLINKLQIQQDTNYTLNGVTVADSCVSFMSESQMLGRDGQIIFKNFLSLSSELPLLYRGESLNKICPRYTNFEAREKATLWVIILTMMSHFESSCNPRAQAAGPNGVANGYYQLHKGQESAYDGANLTTCKNGSSSNPQISHQCALGMLEYQFEKQRGLLFSPDSYWDVLRPQGRSKKAGLIYRAIQKSSLCSPSRS